MARRKGLDCSSPAAIRSFKDDVRSRLNPNEGVDESWAECLCGASARTAGFNSRRPPVANGFPGFPKYYDSDPAGSLDRERKYFLDHLKVDEEQAGELVDCVWGWSQGP